MLKRVLSYSISLSILAATLQIPVFSHTCYLFGVTEVSLYSSAHCGDVQENRTSAGEKVLMSCCSLDLKTYKADIQTHPVKMITDFTFTFLANTFSVTDLLSSSFEVGTYIQLRPPPDLLFNRTLLHFIQVLRL